MKYFLTKSNLAILCLTFIIGTPLVLTWLHFNRHRFPNTLVMNYSDFKPSSRSYELLGFESDEGNTQGPDNPNGGTEEKVVIYRNVDLATVKKTYPTLRGKPNYRFVEYGEAMGFLEKQIRELKAEDGGDSESIKLKKQLISECEQTRAKIIEGLGA